MPKYSPAKRKEDVRVEITRSIFTELATRFHIKKGSVLDGWIDSKGNFHSSLANAIIYPTHYKMLGKFVFRKQKAKS